MKLNLTFCNLAEEPLEGLVLSFAFPKPEEFQVVGHLYPPADDDGSWMDSNNTGYPDVTQIELGAVTSIKLGDLAPKSPGRVFPCVQRLAVGPEMAGKKVAIKFTLRAKNKKKTGRGRLKITFGDVAAEA